MQASLFDGMTRFSAPTSVLKFRPAAAVLLPISAASVMISYMMSDLNTRMSLGGGVLTDPLSLVST